MPGPLATTTFLARKVMPCELRHHRSPLQPASIAAEQHPLVDVSLGAAHHVALSYVLENRLETGAEQDMSAATMGQRTPPVKSMVGKITYARSMGILWSSNGRGVIFCVSNAKEGMAWA